MANLNKVMLIGRLTRDVETRTFSNGGKVAKFGFAVTGSRKKNQQTGKWEDEPCFLDVEIFNRGELGKQADNAEQWLSKGKQVFIEGKLTMQNWTGQDGQKRNKIVVVADSFQFLEPRGDGNTGGGGDYQRSGSSRANQYDAPPPDDGPEPQANFAPDESTGGKDDIPF
jgi:single-strand DNA-binding protein